MPKYLLVPSAKLIPEELRADFGPLPSGMIPLRGKPALHYILSSYAEMGFTSRVAVGDNHWLTSDYLARHPELQAAPLIVGDTRSLAETVFLALEQLPGIDSLAINFADTLIGNVTSETNSLIYD